MTTERATVTHEERRSWIPMIGLFLAQILMSFNVPRAILSDGGTRPDDPDHSE